MASHEVLRYGKPTLPPGSSMPHAELDQVLNVLIPQAKRLLAKDGEFYPFCAFLEPGVEPAPLKAHGKDEQPTVEEVLARLEAASKGKAQAGEIAAIGICLNAWVTPPDTGERTDAIEVRLEHRDGVAMRVFLPYSKQGDDLFVYGEIFAAKSEPTVFGS